MVNSVAVQETLVTELEDMPGHLVRRFQQIAVAIFHAEVGEAGFDLTPVQFAALESVRTHPGIDQMTLAGLIAYDRTTIGGVVDRLVQKGFLTRSVSDKDRRARVLKVSGEGLKALEHLRPAVEKAQKVMLSGLTAEEAEAFMHLLRKATTSLNDLSRAPRRGGSSKPAD